MHPGQVARLQEIAAHPDQLRCTVDVEGFDPAVLRPLVPADVVCLGQFYGSLSQGTRQFYDVPADVASLAAEQCQAVGRFDKLRLVLEFPNDGIAGIFEFSLDLVDDDINRYQQRQVKLIPGQDIRYGLCLADRYQGKGVAACTQPALNQVARTLGAVRIILWGGVFASNRRAIAYYRRVGFQEIGQFVNADGVPCLDMILELEAR